MKKERNIRWLILSVSGISALAWLTNAYNPERSTLFVFFGLIFIIFTALSQFITNNMRRSVLFAFGVVFFLLLRFLGLREFYYPLLLIASLLSLELYMNKR